MLRNVTAGIDGSRESLAAAEWAAREAESLGLALKLVQVWEPVPAPMAQAPLLGPETQQHWTEQIPREGAEALRRRHPGLEVSTEQVTGSPADALIQAARHAELLVLGSRGLGGLTGFLVGSVGLSVVAHTERPVVLVRAQEEGAEGAEPGPGTPARAQEGAPVVLGLDTDHPDATLIDFAFEAAARRAVPLRVVHAWNPPPYTAYGAAYAPPLQEALVLDDAATLTEVLRPWRQKFPGVEVIEESAEGSAAVLVVAAAREACLAVVGRRAHRSPLGAHIGHVTHAVLHHSPAPVAVVPHG